MGLAVGEAVAVFGESGPSLRRVRSTLLCSGIAELRSHGLFGSYAAKLDPAARDVLVNAIPGTWLDLDVVMQHFAAVESLHLTTDEAFAIGSASGKRIQQSVLQTLVRLAAGAGANPWTVFQVYDRLWPRIMDGGGFAISRVGPKDAVLRYTGMPPCRFGYFRHAFRGANHVAIGLFARTVFVDEVARRASADGMELHCSWA